MFEKLTRSLSFRLLAVFLALAALFIYGATMAIRWIYSSDDLRELISGHLALHVDYVRRDIGDPPQIDRALAITKLVPVDIRIAGPDINWASNPDFPQMADLQFGESEIFSQEPDAWLNELKDVEFAVLGQHRFLKIAQGTHAIVVSSPRIADVPSGPDLLPIILGIGLIWLFIAYVAVRWLFSPIDAIREGASRIGAGDFNFRISNYRQDQLGDLAEDVNKLASDVGGMLDAKRHLLLGISHELRSPLSRLRLALEFLEDGSQKEDLRVEIAEMEQIVATLLEAERLNTRHASLNRTTVSVRDLIEQLIESYFERDAGKIELQFDDDAMTANVDDVRLILLLKNLIGNALRYSEQGAVMIRVSMRDGDLVIQVRDRGPGFSEQQAAHFAEPFFRGDPSRTRQTGGTGLGLYISRLIAEAHGGSLELDRGYTDGAGITVRLPA